jgi:GntR family transcriptional regulator
MMEDAQTWHQDRPIYRQLMEQIIARILDNTYREGEMLPSVRQLASDFVVNPLTAARAYRELEEYTETRRGLDVSALRPSCGNARRLAPARPG